MKSKDDWTKQWAGMVLASMIPHQEGSETMQDLAFTATAYASALADEFDWEEDNAKVDRISGPAPLGPLSY